MSEQSTFLSQSVNTIKIKRQGKANGLFLSNRKLTNIPNIWYIHTNTIMLKIGNAAELKDGERFCALAYVCSCPSRRCYLVNKTKEEEL